MIRRMESQTPTAREVRLALGAVLASPMFETAGRAREFLRYIVEETLAGRGDRLKGYAIAVAVFERGPDFDAQADPLVRVEAGRLRRRLAEYYDGQGRDAAVRITLPRGGYTPTFAYGTPRDAFGVPAARRRALRWTAGLAALVVVGLVATSYVVMRKPGVAPAASSPAPTPASAAAAPLLQLPRVVVLPFESVGDATFEALARGITEELIRAQVDFNIVTTASVAASTLAEPSLARLREQFDAGYAVSGTVRSEANRIRITVRLTDTELGTQLWTRTLDERLDEAGMLPLEERVGRTIATLLSSPYGPVYGHEIDRVIARPVVDLNPFECVLRFYGYTRSLAPAEHAACVRCLQRAVEVDPSFALAWSSLAVLYLHEYTYGYDPQPDRGPALDRAREAARRALDLDGSGRVAGMALASIRLVSGDRAGFEQAAERALALAPPHPAVAMQIGYLLALSGDWRRGRPLVEQALAATVRAPGWYHGTFVLAALQQEQYGEALQAALKMDAPDWFGTPLMVAASAALAGRTDIAEREAQRLLALSPDFPQTGGALLRRWGMDEALLATLLDGLRLAGVDVH
jgi:TolB-like protein